MAEVIIRSDLPGQPVFLRVGEDVEGIYDYAIWDTRIKWLPAWFPFNSYADNSPEARLTLVDYLRKYGEKLEAAKGGYSMANGDKPPGKDEPKDPPKNPEQPSDQPPAKPQ